MKATDPSLRYLRIVRWAMHRYARNGYVDTHVGGKPTVYTRIENAAWGRLMANSPEITSR